MKSQLPSRLTRFTIALTLPPLLAALAFAAQPFQDTEETAPSAVTVRAEVGAMYERWGRARVEYDRETMESILAPDFHVLLDGREISREKFLGDVSRSRPGIRLTRFDADILTVQRSGKDWTVVITEKIELELTAADGETRTMCSFWVTRDGCRKAEGRWIVTFSEAIGHEEWPPGSKPPFEDW